MSNSGVRTNLFIVQVGIFLFCGAADSPFSSALAIEQISLQRPDGLKSMRFADGLHTNPAILADPIVKNSDGLLNAY